MKAMEERSSNIDKLCDDDEYDENEHQTYADLFSGDIFEFKPSHPGSKFSHLAELNLEVIPKISLPPGKLCNIEMLHMNENDVDDRITQYREDYAKMALVMFYPFRTLDDLKKNHSYWNLFD